MNRWILLPLTALFAFCAACVPTARPEPLLSEASFAPATDSYVAYTPADGGYTLEIPAELGDPTESDGVTRFESAAGDLVCIVSDYQTDPPLSPSQAMESVPFTYGDVTVDLPDRQTKIGVGNELDGMMAHVRTAQTESVTVTFSFAATRIEACQDYFTHATDTLQFSSKLSS